MNKEENKIMDLIVKAHAQFIDLKQTHPSDITEWANHIHGLQKIISLRMSRRDYPEIFPTYKT